MKTLSEMRTYIEEQIEDDSNPTLVDLWLNRSLEALCAKHEFTGYKRFLTITPDANGQFFVPPSYIGTTLLRPEDTDTFKKFIFLSEINLYGTRVARPYYTLGNPRAAQGYTETGITITNGDSTITGTGSGFLSTDVGDVLLIGNSSYEYTVTSFTNVNNIAFLPEYRGAGGSLRVTVRPRGTKTMIVYDETDTVYTSDIVLYYKVNPQPLYNDQDKLEADIGEAVEFRALIEAYRNEKYNVDAERLRIDLQEAISNALNAEVTPPNQSLPEGLYGGGPAWSIHSNRSRNITTR